MSGLATEDICLVSTADICPVSAADICPVSTADICPVSTEDIYPVSTADIKCWPAEAATAADQINDRESLACGGRDSGRPKSLHGATDDPSLTTKQNRHRHVTCDLDNSTGWMDQSHFRAKDAPEVPRGKPLDL